MWLTLHVLLASSHQEFCEVSLPDEDSRIKDLARRPTLSRATGPESAGRARERRAIFLGTEPIQAVRLFELTPGSSVGGLFGKPMCPATAAVGFGT